MREKFHIDSGLIASQLEVAPTTESASLFSPSAERQHREQDYLQTGPDGPQLRPVQGRHHQPRGHHAEGAYVPPEQGSRVGLHLGRSHKKQER